MGGCYEVEVTPCLFSHLHISHSHPVLGPTQIFYPILGSKETLSAQIVKHRIRIPTILSCFSLGSSSLPPSQSSSPSWVGAPIRCHHQPSSLSRAEMSALNARQSLLCADSTATANYVRHDSAILENLEGLWFCNIRYGMVPVEKRRVNNNCSPGQHVEYLLRTPKNGMRACLPDAKFTYDFWGYSSQCAINHLGSAPWYTLATPHSGLHACEIPPGWGSQKIRDPGICGPNDDTPVYILTCPPESLCGSVCCSGSSPVCVNSVKEVFCAK
jgi:hypothetical protein